MSRYFFVPALVLLLSFSNISCGGGESPTPTTLLTSTSSPEPTATTEPPPTVAPTFTLEPTATTQATVSPTATLLPTVTAVPTLPATATSTPPPPPTATPEPTAAATATSPPPPTFTPEPTAAATVTPPPPATSTPEPTATLVPEPQVTSPVTIEASKDNTLYEDSGGQLSNGAGRHLFAGRTNSGLVRRGVIAFDIAGNIPDDVIISGVSLTLNMSKTQALAETVQLHRLMADWGEGASNASANEGAGIASESGDATWAHMRYDSETWETPGGDFSTASSAAQTVVGVGLYTWGSTDNMVSDVQSWLDDTSTNFGWLLLGNEDENRTTKRFDSRENSTEANRPALTIEFTLR